ncbi:MAG: methyltransferase [bacterium]
MEKDLINIQKESVHKVLAHSYSIYFLFFLIGICFDLVFGLNVLSDPSFAFVGVLFLIFGSLLILWAQRTSRNLKVESVTVETFRRGPYRYTRTPTNFGLFFLMLGFGMAANTFFVLVFSLVSFVVAKLIFLERQEKILEQKYGAPYLEYKKLVWF